ncbi:MAG: acyltransferase family protein [Candidatus Obscuribacter phosphatis]|uniref:Acyltransferase family protein n=1 Tax=Candidatus Obscuribacter phosphatis TaxID=1906157 RepID=A0A8J7P8W4_9BACT|nr:acyltransferase family protein [Candidatus Obscuribacter phosphatis]
MKKSLQRLFSEDPVARLARTNPDFVRRYSAPDQFGFSLETYARWEPFFRFLFEEYFKVRVKGVENIPRDGAAILVGNHSGLLPLDGAMISMAMASGHDSARRIRYLVTDWFFHIPGLSNWVKATGQVRASLSNARQLIEMGELVGIYPEGIRGVGKPFRERYRVLDFHPGFVQLAIATGTPLIPVSTLGGDEIYPEFTNLKEIAHFLKMPFFPVTLTFPWLPFPLMLIPLPIRWMVHVHKPIKLDYPPEKASDRKLVLRLARQIQYEIQDDLNRMLRQRKLLFTSPEPDQDEQEFSNYKQEKIAEAIDEDE